MIGWLRCLLTYPLEYFTVRDRRLGPPIAKASELATRFGGKAWQGGLKEKFFMVGYSQNLAYSGWFLQIACPTFKWAQFERGGCKAVCLWDMVRRKKKIYLQFHPERQLHLTRGETLIWLQFFLNFQLYPGHKRWLNCTIINKMIFNVPLLLVIMDEFDETKEHITDIEQTLTPCFISPIKLI